MTTETGLSARGQQLVDTPAMPSYLLEHFARAPNSCDPSLGEEGYIGLCVAENRLVYDLLAPRVNGARQVPPEALAYADMTGPEPFRQALARFLSLWVLGREVAAEHLVALAGAGSILESMFWLLADEGDAVLVPTPSYAGFWMDLELRDRLQIIEVHGRRSDGFAITPAALDAAVDAATSPVRALLFTTPNNPLGTLYSAEELEAVLAWAESRGIHVVFDEVYALSVFGDQPFTSAASLRQRLGSHVHIVWGFSKDFAASGLRCGVLVTENEALRAGMSSLSYWACCSGDTLQLLQDLLTDTAWVETYIHTMRARLGAAYAQVATVLAAHDIEFVPSSAGFFVVLDLARWLPEPTFAGEQTLWRRLLDEVDVNLTPGASMRCAEPGLFRLCFASVSPDVLTLAMARLTRFLR